MEEKSSIIMNSGLITVNLQLGPELCNSVNLLVLASSYSECVYAMLIRIIGVTVLGNCIQLFINFCC